VFELTTQGAVTVLSGNQPVKQEQADELATVVRRAADGGQPLVVLDLQRVPLFDSTGLEALLDAQDAIEQRGGLLKMAAPNELIRDLLRVGGMADRFEVFSDVKSAVGSFAK
jgi:anti-anti-sigma factor